MKKCYETPLLEVVEYLQQSVLLTQVSKIPIGGESSGDKTHGDGGSLEDDTEGAPIPGQP